MRQDDGRPPRLRMKGVSKSFGATAALSNVSLEVRAGEVLALVGENGAGKSTLMKVLSGVHRPDHGEMWLDGEKYAPGNPRDGRRAAIAMIYQELSLAPHLSVMENILLGIEPMRGLLFDWRAARRLASDALATIGAGGIDPAMRISQLSVAQQQLVEIARGVAVGCRVLVLDEPTSSLTMADIEHLFALIEKLREDGLAIIYISHFLEEVKRISDRFTVLRDGQSVGGGSTDAAEVDQIIALMVGRDLKNLYPRSQRTPGEVVMRLDGLCGESLPRNATLQLRRGEILGIAGLVGAGRTEMLRAVFALDTVKRGTVSIAGTSGRSPGALWRGGTGMVSEDRKNEGLALNLSIADNLTLPQMRGLGPLGLIFSGRQRDACRPWVDRLAMRCRSTAQATGDMSGGNQQKVAIARLLHADVDVLLLDEPTRGIDVGSKAEIYQLIDDLARGDAQAGRSPKAVLLISSYLPELLGVCDRIAVMCRGVLLPPKPVGERNEHEIMLEATGAGDRT